VFEQLNTVRTEAFPVLTFSRSLFKKNATLGVKARRSATAADRSARPHRGDRQDPVRESRDALGDRRHGDLPQDVWPRLLRRELLPEKSRPLHPNPPLLSLAHPTAHYSSSGACALGMELGGSHRSACIDAKMLKAYSITVTLPLFMASLAFDRRTASADGYPFLIPSLPVPHSITVEQPAAPFLPTPHSLAEVDIEETGTRRLEIDPHARNLRARLKLPAYQNLAISSSSVPPLGAATATHASQTSPPPTTTLSPLSTAPTPTPLTTTSTQPTTASPRPRRFS